MLSTNLILHFMEIFGVKEIKKKKQTQGEKMGRNVEMN